MKKIAPSKLLSIVLLGMTLISAGQSRAQEQWRQEVHYQIEASLDTLSKTISGHIQLTYLNNSPNQLEKLYFLVPSNAFTEEENTAVQELKRLNQGGNFQFR